MPQFQPRGLQGSHYDRQYKGLSTSSFPSATLPLVFWTLSPLLLSIVLYLPYFYIGCQLHEQFHTLQQPIQAQSTGFSRRVPQGVCLDLSIHYKQVKGRLHPHIADSQAAEPQRETTCITVLCHPSLLSIPGACVTSLKRDKRGGRELWDQRTRFNPAAFLSFSA